MKGEHKEVLSSKIDLKRENYQASSGRYQADPNASMQQHDLSGRSLNETHVDMQSPAIVQTEAHESALPPTLPRYHHPNESSKLFMSPNRAVAGTSMQSARDTSYSSSLDNISRIPHVANSSSGGSGNDSSPESVPYDINSESKFPGARSDCKEKPSSLTHADFFTGNETTTQKQKEYSRITAGPVSVRKTVDVLELEIQELKTSLSSVEDEMAERLRAMATKYNEIRDKDRRTIYVCICAPSII